jgi:hypothetical protein
LCGTCHAQIDPYRTTDHLNKPVDGRTTLPPALGGGEVTSAVDLAEKLAASPEFTNCMARTVLQYALVDFTAPVEVPIAGKTAGCAVIDVVDRYKSASGKTFSDLIRATAATPAFAVRKTTP